MVCFLFLYFIMMDTKNNTEHKAENKSCSYKIGKYKINVKREFEKQGAIVLDNIMCMIYDEMEARRQKKK